jgi:serine/threonine protein phosphatase PrpC
MDRPHSLTFEFYCATDRGRVRTNNEDSVALDESAALVVLADGMGGYNAGEVASGMATTVHEVRTRALADRRQPQRRRP